MNDGNPGPGSAEMRANQPLGRVLLYDAVDEPLEWLQVRGIEVTEAVPPFSTGRSRPKIPEPELVRLAAGHVALLGASGTFVTRRAMEQLPQLRYISKLGVGYEVIDMEAATSLGIMVTNTPGLSETDLVAEHTCALMLAVVKQMTWYSQSYIQQGGWKDPMHMMGSLRGKTIGIVGLGRIGRGVQERLTGWGAKIVATDVQPVAVPGGVEMLPLEELLQGSDVVTLHLPGLPPGSPPLLDAKRLSLLRPTAIVVNTARGNLIDQPALLAMLKAGTLGGAGLDVFSPEPPASDDPILTAPNLVLTPHVAAWNRNLRKEMAMTAFENLRAMMAGETPAHLINPEVLVAGVR